MQEESSSEESSSEESSSEEESASFNYYANARAPLSSILKCNTKVK